MIPFELNDSIQMLQRTPSVLESLLIDVPEEWLRNNEGKNSWSPYHIVGHFIHNERTDWLPRIKIILSDAEHKTFEPFDREGHFQYDQSVPIEQALKEFRMLRSNSLSALKKLEIDAIALAKTGIHPAFEAVNLKQLLAAWVVHDLGHIGQITRVMAKQYKEEMGPWEAYLPILNR